jgi:folate-binding protein YgfZ
VKAYGALPLASASAAVAIVPRAELEVFRAAAERQGACLVGADEWQRIRLELGIGAFGTDYGPSDNPHEAGLDRAAISWKKGCYLGQEVVFMQDARGKLKRRLVSLSVDKGSPAPGSELRSEAGEVVGEITSVVPVRAGAVALGRVRAPHFEPGSRLLASGFSAEVRPVPVGPGEKAV